MGNTIEKFLSALNKKDGNFRKSAGNYANRVHIHHNPKKDIKIPQKKDPSKTKNCDIVFAHLYENPRTKELFWLKKAANSQHVHGHKCISYIFHNLLSSPPVKIKRDLAKKILDSELPKIVDYLNKIEKDNITLEDLDYNHEEIEQVSTYLIERQIRNVGGGYRNHEDNRKVEKAAIKFVIRHYKQQGWNVQSVEFEKRGYDLLCTKGTREEHVEVKGIKGTELSFIVTSREVEQAHIDPHSVFCVVTSALSKRPKLSRFTGKEFINSFKLNPLAFKAIFSLKK
jgi:hypothetical protein